MRWRQARSRANVKLVTVASVSLIAFLAAGGYLYYDARVVNTNFTPRRANEVKWARYEREFKQYETLPQPKITALEVAVDIVPEQATITANGTYTLVNKSSVPIPSVHILDNNRALKKLTSIGRSRRRSLTTNSNITSSVRSPLRQVDRAASIHVRPRESRLSGTGTEIVSWHVLGCGIVSHHWLPA